MQLSLTQLALLIELTEIEIAQMKGIIDNPESSDAEADDASEHSMQLLALSSTLQTMYKELHGSSHDSDMTYDELITDIHTKRL